MRGSEGGGNKTFQLDESMKSSWTMTHQIEILGTIFFALAVLHTFSVKKFLDWSHHFPKDSPASAILHFLGEIEVVFGLWAGIFYLVFGSLAGFGEVVSYQEKLKFTEPLFVFCIMVVAATRPVLNLARDTIQFISQILSRATGISRLNTDLFVILTFGPLSGSFITEPAAMTVTALLLLKMMDRPTNWFAHFLVGLLFVNVSIGGALTPYAAPPILMVAGTWNWDFNFVFSHFGWKSALAVTSNTLLFLFLGQKYLKSVLIPLPREASDIPWPVTFVHYAFLVAMVLAGHYPNTVMGVFLFFLGVSVVTKKYQDPLRLRESLLVAFFLGGIVVFGAFQRWWLEPILAGLDAKTLFLSAAGLTAITDNAALTYLGSQVSSLSVEARYYLVAGAIAGGGLTVIANAPNAAGYGILQSKIRGGIHPLRLFLAALAPTLVALAFLALP